MAMRPASSSRWLSRLWSRLLTRRGCLCISLLLLLRASLWRSSASRCLAAPPTWRALDGTLMRATTAPTTRTEPSFILLWSTDESQFRLVSKRALEAIFFHHPYASVRVFSNTLPLDFLSPLSAAGFRASVHRYNLSELLAETPAAAWISSTQPEAEEGPYYYSHLTDVLRLALLYKEGGVYLDSDVLLLRPFRLADVPTTHASLAPAAATAPMRNAIGIESYTGSSWSPFRNHVLNGAVLVFPPSSPFLWNAMDEFARTYNPKLWGWNGPELLTRVHARCGFGGDDEVQVLPPDAFYPLYWEDIELFASAEQLARQEAAWERMRERSYAVHLWNRKTARLRPDRRSLMHRLLSTFVVLPYWKHE